MDTVIFAFGLVALISAGGMHAAARRMLRDVRRTKAELAEIIRLIKAGRYDAAENMLTSSRKTKC